MKTRLWMACVALVGAALVAGCGGKAREPEVISRTLPAKDSPSRDGGPELIDETDPDGGFLVPDGGICCAVGFAIPALPGDQTAALVLNGTAHLDLTRDGGGWYGQACLPLEPVNYYYEVGLASDEQDGGLFLVTRVNDGVPSTVGGAVSQLNVFDPGAATTCEALDAGVHGQLPDAG